MKSGLGHHVLSNGKKRIGQFVNDKFMGVIKKETEVQTVEIKKPETRPVELKVQRSK